MLTHQQVRLNTLTRVLAMVSRRLSNVHHMTPSIVQKQSDINLTDCITGTDLAGGVRRGVDVTLRLATVVLKQIL